MCSHLIGNKKKSQAAFIFISKLWMRCWLTLVGCPIKIKGKHHFKKDEAYIITLNHNTLLDIPLSCPFVPGANKTIAKSSFTKVPLFGFFYAKGAVLVDRKNEKSRRESFYQMKDVLANGIHMCIYPEGTRNRTKEPLKSFYDGAFRLAVETGNKIMPAIIFNTGKAMPNNKFFYLLPHKLEMHFLEPIAVNNDSAESLKDKVYNTMLHYYSTNQ